MLFNIICFLQSGNKKEKITENIEVRFNRNYKLLEEQLKKINECSEEVQDNFFIYI